MLIETLAGFIAKIITALGLSVSLTIIPVMTMPMDATSSGQQMTLNDIGSTTNSLNGVSTANDSLVLPNENLPKGGAWLTELPLGDGKYVTAAPKKGYIYVCHVGGEGGGAQKAGPWIHTTSNTWTPKSKIHVSGDVSWPTAATTIKISGANRLITTNDLPTTHTSGVFPVASADAAFKYDRNPNSISAQNFTFSLPANPTIAATPGCIFGEVGIMTSGVLLFDGFDAENRDAAAWEVQDHCDAHPQASGAYHYHSLSGCIKSIGVSDVIGYAFDGFPITGPKLPSGNYLQTADLDECHGLVSNVSLNGKTVSTYHYVMTQDFPYSVSCFKGKSTVIGPLGGRPTTQQQPVSSGTPTSGGSVTQQPSIQTGTNPASQNGPPQEAVQACVEKQPHDDCSFVSPMGDTISGICDSPPNSSLACIPN